MSNLIKHRKLNRTKAHRAALLRNLTISLVEHGSIRTTLPKAKEMRSFVEKLVTRSKNENLANCRFLKSKLNNKDSIKKLFKVIGPMNKDRPGGYTRVIKSGYRKGDNAPMAVIQFVDSEAAS